MSARTRTWLLLGGLTAAAVVGFFSVFDVAIQEVPTNAARILEPALNETSGITASNRTANLLWALNDSKGEAVLYGVSTEGKPVAKLQIRGVKNADWEALAAFRLDGRSWLAIGDIGDNGAQRKSSIVYFVEEPPASELTPAKPVVLDVAWRIDFRYDDGPRDSEAMVVDPRLRQVLLLSKRNKPPHVYSLPLVASKGKVLAVARRVGSLPSIPQPNTFQRLIPSPTARYRGQPTDAALSPDGTALAVISYGDLLLFRRTPGQEWPSVLERARPVIKQHHLSQAEAVCFSADGEVIFVTGEGKNAPLLQFDLNEAR